MNNYPKEECGIFAISNNNEAAQLTYFGLYALQHRGQESAGIAILDDSNKIKVEKKMGLVPDVFDKNTLGSLKGKTAIGHVRYSTTGDSVLSNAQPFVVNHQQKHYAIVHNGNFVNAHQVKNELENKGSIFQTTMDSEIFLHLYIQNLKNHSVEDAIKETKKKIKGAYSIIILNPDGTIVGLKDPNGFRPLCLGKLNGSYIISSESCALDLVQAKFIKELENNEIVIIDNDKIKEIKEESSRESFCIFEYIYFARPDSCIYNQNVYQIRKNLGIQMAKEAHVDADLVMPFPDSGNYAAIGYSQKANIPFEMGMIRNHYVGRSFIEPTQSMRDAAVNIKLNPVRNILEGKDIIIVDDSIIRGTTAKTRIAKLKKFGVKKIHMRISCPPHKFPCYFGVDFPTTRELIAAKMELEELRKYIGLDSLHYLSLDGMLKATCIKSPKEKFCTACFDGNYPIKIEDKGINENA